MQTGTILVALLFAVTSFPFLGQNSSSATQPSDPAAMQHQSPAAGTQQPSSPEASPEGNAMPQSKASMPEMRTVRAELVSKLDSKTAKAGDNIVVQTKDAVKTADGTDLPKGTKLMGHVVGVQPSADGKNSEVALELDHAEMASGQDLPIQSQIQSVGTSNNSSAEETAPMDRSTMSPGPSAGAVAGGATASAAGVAPMPGRAPGMAPAPEANRAPAAGMVVARTGQIAIRTTSIPGVLLANNEPGRLDPRMAHASSILLGAKQDVKLSEGTPVVVGVATAAK